MTIGAGLCTKTTTAIATTSKFDTTSRTLVATIKAHLANAAQSAEESKQRHITAGLRLNELKAHPIRTRRTVIATGSSDDKSPTAEHFWRYSLTNLAGEPIAMRAFLTREFAKWETF